MKTWNILGLVLGGLALVLCLCLGLGSAWFFHLAIQRNPKPFLDTAEDLDVNRKPSVAFSDEWLTAQKPEEVQIQAGDGTRLHAWYVPAPRGPVGPGRAPGPRRAAILAHGYMSEGRYMGGFARFYSEVLGCAVLLPDARAHGKSGGRYIGFGWPDRLDYLRWIAWLEGRSGPGTAIVLHGVSMGAATVMMVSGEDSLPPSVKAIVEDCGYTSVEEEFDWQMGRLYHLPSWPLVPLTGAMTELRAGWSFREASALDQVRRSRVPILFIHGEEDSFVPFSMEFRLYDACPEPKEILVVPGAGHALSYDTDPIAYEARVRLFAEKYLR